MTIDLTPTEVLAGIGVLLLVVLVWRSGARKAKRAAEAARTGARVVSLAGHLLLVGGALLGVQWLVIHNVDNPTLLVILLAVPDLIAANVLIRAVTVTDIPTTRRGGRR